METLVSILCNCSITLLGEFELLFWPFLFESSSKIEGRDIRSTALNFMSNL